MEPPITTRVALLQALRDGPGYGKDLIRRVGRITDGVLRLSAARVYPCLQALKREGLASARIVTPGRKRGARARTYYELTPLGAEVSSTHRRILRAVVRGSRSGAPPSADSRLMAKRLIAADELSGNARLLHQAMGRSKRNGSS